MKTLIRTTFGPLCLMICCTPFVMVMWYVNTALQGSFAQFFVLIWQQGLLLTIKQIWAPVFWGSAIAWQMIASFVLFQFVLIKILPGKTFYGPITPKGNIPVYKANGISAFIMTVVTFYVLSVHLKLFSPTLIYDHLGEILGALNIFSLLLCVGLYFKGRFYPSSTDSGTTGNILFDYYWGSELYPRVAGVNLKMFINCRLGMMSWGIFLLSYAFKQAEIAYLSSAMVVAVALQMIYIAKFFIWETGYLASLDIMHDRAGFYICWGCLVWVPCIYTSPTMYLVQHPYTFSTLTTLTLFVAGTLAILVNYMADRQRQWVRATNGQCLIWRKVPRVTRAKYQTELGETKENLLLSSGWWGIARHFHYVPEITAAFLWSVPALFTHFSPYFYVCFLTILLLDRTQRDDVRCAQKYGQSWQQYCQYVPYKMMPFIY